MGGDEGVGGEWTGVERGEWERVEEGRDGRGDGVVGGHVQGGQ